MPNAAVHPTPQELSAFALGKLDDAAEAAVVRHLETCSACRNAIEKLPADSFVGKLRAAKPSVSALPARTGNAPKLPAAEAAPSLPLKDLPPELAHYSKYRFVRELGRGGMGVVYQAEQTVMGRSVAVKVINPSVLDHPDALPRFQSEVRAAAKLDHPNIVRAYDADQVGGLHLLVMEFVEGTNLAGLVAKKGPLPVPFACHFIRQAALGLQHAFEQGMVHRDIKPQNLMVNARGQVKVLDFGLARMRSERRTGGGLTQADAFMGTPEYVSPEQATDARSADTRADIYSLGCTLFFLLTGRPPFQEDTIVKQILAQIEKEPPALHEMRADVPAELSAVVARMLAKDPARRFQTPVEVAEALAAFVKPGTKRPPGVSSSVSGASSPATGTMLAADTSKIKAILRELPGKTPGPAAPVKEATSVFAGLEQPVASAKKLARPARKTAKATRKAAWYRRRPLLAGAGAAVLALGLGTWLLAGIVSRTRENPPIAEKPPVKPVTDGFVQLFNGKDLTGWKTHDKQPGNWRIEKGTNGNVLTGSGAVVSYLYSERGDYKDFHLLVETRINDGDNGGVYIRAPFGPQLPMFNPIYPSGYEALISSARRDFGKTGTLYVSDDGGMFNIREVPAPPGKWFWMEVIAEGNHITVKVNGKLTADYTDDKRRFSSGHIVLEQFGAGTEVEFRTIKIKELPSRKAEEKAARKLFKVRNVIDGVLHEKWIRG